MNGKTVEINNTDAEGRLVLADAITYAIREENATEIVTVATLTGAIRVALGETFTGVFANDEKFGKTLTKQQKKRVKCFEECHYTLILPKISVIQKLPILKIPIFPGKPVLHQRQCLYPNLSKTNHSSILISHQLLL